MTGGKRVDIYRHTAILRFEFLKFRISEIRNFTHVAVPSHITPSIWVYTVCKGKKDLQTKEYIIFLNFQLPPTRCVDYISVPKYFFPISVASHHLS